MTRKWVSALTALLLALSASPALAQGSATSSITGVVVDLSGGVIPGASVVVKSESTGAEFTAVTNSNGAFTVPALAVGTYSVTVPAGRYTITGHSPLYGSGTSLCRATRIATVTSGHSTKADVLCQMR